MAGRGRYRELGADQDDKAALLEELLDVVELHGDLASEATWQDFGKRLLKYWMVFEGEQSPLSTFQMISRCSDTILRIRLAQRSLKGEGGADALEEFRTFMGEVLEEKPDQSIPS